MTHPSAFNVLVADDDDATRRLFVDTLKKQGLMCTQASNGAHALAKIQEQSFDLLVTDLRMPMLHGHALIQKVWEQKPGQPILVITAVAEEKLIKDLYLRGVEDVILKPPNLETFSARVLGILRRNDQRRKRLFSEVQLAGSGSSKEAVSQRLKETTGSLQQQLEDIQQQFAHSIKSLERQSEGLERDYVGSVRVLANLMDQVGHLRGSHATRVEEFTTALGQEVALDKIELRDLSLASLLHDIGKFGMPDEAIRKRPDRLASHERAIYERHPLIGATLVGEVPGAAQIMDLIEAHHENFDGSGFPAGAKGLAVPLAARMIRLADGIDNIHRYSELGIKDWNAAVRHLQDGSHTLYDPKLAQLAVQHIEQLILEQENRRIVEIGPSELRPGHRLAGDLHDSHGRLLAREGIALTEAMLDRVRHLWELDGRPGYYIRVHAAPPSS